MLETIVPLFIAIVPYAALGSGVRVAWGMYKAYNSFLSVNIKWIRVLVELLAGMMFGIFGGVLLSTLGIFTIGMSLGTLIASLLGANVVELIAKKFGWSKKMDVVVSEQQLQFPELNSRQINALQYVQSKGSITNHIYQKMNNTTNNVAKYELQALVEKKKLRKAGRNRGAYYVAA